MTFDVNEVGEGSEIGTGRVRELRLARSAGDTKVKLKN